MIRFEFCDKNNQVSTCEWEACMESQEPLLKAVQAGEEQYRDSLGWLHVGQWAGDENIKEMERQAAKVKKDGEVLVVIGIGGSNQAARAAVKALKGPGGVEVLFAGNNLSPFCLQETLNRLQGKSVYVNVVAKNFETLEPGIAFRIFRRYLEERYGHGARERILATGTRRSWLYQLCQKHGYGFLDFPQDIGGRYSALCNVGLFPMAVAGLDIGAMAKGAMEMEETLRKAQGKDNLAFRYGTIRNLLRQKGYGMEMMASFEPRYRFFHSWWTQLFAESEGKDGKGLYPVSANYSEDLHSIGQFVQQGAPLLFETFLQVEAKDGLEVPGDDLVDDKFSYLSGRNLGEISSLAFQATWKAHSERLPCLKISPGRLDESSFGQLFYFFAFACYLSARLLGVNPFDQPGVESYKRYMFEALGKWDKR